jgi:hypothetical protein
MHKFCLQGIFCFRAVPNSKIIVAITPDFRPPLTPYLAFLVQLGLPNM